MHLCSVFNAHNTTHTSEFKIPQGHAGACPPWCQTPCRQLQSKCHMTYKTVSACQNSKYVDIRVLFKTDFKIKKILIFTNEILEPWLLFEMFIWYELPLNKMCSLKAWSEASLDMFKTWLSISERKADCNTDTTTGLPVTTAWPINYTEIGFFPLLLGRMQEWNPDTFVAASGLHWYIGASITWQFTIRLC